jgi:hypothetical protein
MLRAIDFKFLSGLQELGYRSWSAGTCGLHVHIAGRVLLVLVMFGSLHN